MSLFLTDICRGKRMYIIGTAETFLLQALNSPVDDKHLRVWCNPPACDFPQQTDSGIHLSGKSVRTGIVGDVGRGHHSVMGPMHCMQTILCSIPGTSRLE